MDDRRGTTDDVRSTYAYCREEYEGGEIEDYFEVFDAWLNKVKAEVWDEGNSAGYCEGRGGSIYDTYDDDLNPYRERVNYLKDLRD